MMTVSCRLVAVAVALALAAALLSSSPLHGDVREVVEIRDVELIPVDGGAAGPESVAFGVGGEGPYAGVSDGRVIRWLPEEGRWVDHSSAAAPELLDSCRGSQDPMKEHECGRPLGLKFNNKTGELYVADSYFGLRVVSPGDNVSRLIGPGQPGSPFSFANGVEIDQETGVVYFTETSTRFHRRQFLNIVISGDATGRLLKYDPNTKEVQVLVDGLAFPNGLLMSEDGSHLLLAETTTCKIHRYWLKTPKASTLEELVQLPGFPDNIKASPRGGFWVGLHGKRGKIAEWSTSFPWLRRLVMKLPPQRVQRVMAFLSRFGSQVIALRVSEEGKVLEEVIVHDAARKMFGSISELEERDGCLWIGSVHLPFLGHYCL
ncbi:protein STRICTOSIDINE SYNTHASE-LIKE 10-like [Triticum urartu]|uniref:Strictosidine synthase conserved region domain-containing protein n=3 Tax=Triticum TaxID=4564 RepID=A0A8R7UH60_TRIUA|nr:protein STRICTOSIDINE SYNTHASE-LIKE 10-like [Triticum urartu]